LVKQTKETKQLEKPSYGLTNSHSRIDFFNVLRKDGTYKKIYPAYPAGEADPTYPVLVYSKSVPMQIMQPLLKPSCYSDRYLIKSSARKGLYAMGGKKRSSQKFLHILKRLRILCTEVGERCEMSVL